MLDKDFLSKKIIEIKSKKFKEFLNGRTIRESILQLEDEIEDMKHNLKDHINLSSNADIDMDKLNNRVNELRKQIIEIMNEN